MSFISVLSVRDSVTQRQASRCDKVQWDEDTLIADNFSLLKVACAIILKQTKR